MVSGKYERMEWHKKRMRGWFQKGHKINNNRKHSEETKRKMKKFCGENAKNWNGGETISSEGYVFKLAQNHPYAHPMGYVLKHRLVMEKKLGRYLTKEEVVHHLDGKRGNNLIENLYLFPNKTEHTKYHHFLRKCVGEALCLKQ